MTWLEFFLRVFGWVVAVVLFLIAKEVGERWKEKQGKQVSKYCADEGIRATRKDLVIRSQGLRGLSPRRCLAPLPNLMHWKPGRPITK